MSHYALIIHLENVIYGRPNFVCDLRIAIDPPFVFYVELSPVQIFGVGYFVLFITFEKIKYDLYCLELKIKLCFSAILKYNEKLHYLICHT